MNNKAQSLLEAARRELNRRKAKRAAKYIEQAVEADPDSHELLAERAAMAISPLRDYRSAVEDLTRAIGMAPGVGAYYDMRGQAYWYLREYERAFEDFNKAIELDPKCAPAYYHRGNFSEKLQRYESAIEDMARAVELDPDNRSYKRRLDELKRTAVRHAERLGDEPPPAAVEEEAPPPKEEAPGEEAAPAEDEPATVAAAETSVEPAVLPEPAAAPAIPPVQEPVETEPLVEVEAAPPAEAAPAEEPAPLVEEAPAAEPEPEPEIVEAAAPVAVAETEEAAGRWSVRIPTGEQFGPVTMAVLKLWAEEQRVKPGDELLGPDGNWIAAASVPEIAAVFENLRTVKKPPVRPG
jgi:Tfp pilus assembly protein PilF